MNRPQHIHSLPSTHAECGTLAVAAEDVLPEHALLRLLHEWHVRGDEVDPDIEFALQLSSAIAATQALEPKPAAEPTPEDASTMTDELDTSPVEDPEGTAQIAADVEPCDDLPDIEVQDEPEAEPAAAPEPVSGGPDLGVEELAELLADTAIKDEPGSGPSETFGEAVTFSDGESETLAAELVAGAAADEAGVAEAQAEAPADTPADTEGEQPSEEPEASAELADETEEPKVEEPEEPAEPELDPEIVALASEEPEAAAAETPAEVAAEEVPAESAAAESVAAEDLATEEAAAGEPEEAAATTEEESVAAEAEATVSVPAPEAPAPEPEPAAAPSAAADAGTAQGEEFALTNGHIDRVQDFLGELKGALIEMAQRPQPQPAPPPQPESDIKPLVEALQAGFDRSAEQASQTTVALASLTEHVTQLGHHVEGGVTKTLDKAFERASAHPSLALPAEPTFVDPSGSRQTVVLAAVVLIILGWSILFWIKAGSPRLALGTLIGANAVACCMLLSRRDRS